MQGDTKQALPDMDFVSLSRVSVWLPCKRGLGSLLFGLVMDLDEFMRSSGGLNCIYHNRKCELKCEFPSFSAAQWIQ